MVAVSYRTVLQCVVLYCVVLQREGLTRLATSGTPKSLDHRPWRRRFVEESGSGSGSGSAIVTVAAGRQRTGDRPGTLYVGR